MSFITEKQVQRILVVDDVKDNLFLAQFILETEGYEVDTAENGEAAITKIRTEVPKPNLIVLDIMMPKMDGYEVIHCLRQLNLSYIPILLMTADTNVSYQKAIDSGADGLIYKPIDLKQFLTKVEMFNP